MAYFLLKLLQKLKKIVWNGVLNEGRDSDEIEDEWEEEDELEDEEESEEEDEDGDEGDENGVSDADDSRSLDLVWEKN